jgi:23S rRNA (uridine2552-2'-O)-methyltransferase
MGEKTNVGKGLLCSVDLLKMAPIPGNSFFIQGDFRLDTTQLEIKRISSSYDVVLSDMLQNTSGHHSTDHFRSIELCTTVLDFSAGPVLRQGGSLLCKFLRGSDDKELMDEAKALFSDVRFIKPKASRDESTEMYMLARNKK